MADNIMPLQNNQSVNMDALKSDIMKDVNLRIDQLTSKQDDSNQKVKTLDTQFTQLQNQVI